MVLSWLVPNAEAVVADPCGGEGFAIKRLAEGLQVKPENIYAIELEDDRSLTIKETLAGSNVLAPASFFGTDIRPGSFSLVWCNPPFTDALGGGRRVELDFLSRSLDLLVAGGVIVLVCPERVAGDAKIQAVMLAWCDKVKQFAFPEPVREYGEVVLLGRKRDRLIAKLGKATWSPGNVGNPYELPPAPGPGTRWAKTSLTDTELIRALDNSPLRKRLEPPADKPLPRPPLALGAGHLALLLASGHLDGLVKPENEPGHVVRGIAMKVPEITDEETVEDKNTVTTKTVISEKILLTVRVADHTGTIHTLVQT